MNIDTNENSHIHILINHLVQTGASGRQNVGNE